MNNNISFPQKGYSVEISASRDANALEIPQREIDMQKVITNYEYWNRESNYLSSNNYDNDDFKQIVSMGENAVPGILKIIRERPDPIVHALDLIYPNYMTYKGYVSLEEVCQIWITTLIALGKA